MRLTYISEGSKELGMGHIMHQSVVMDRLKWRALESKRDITIVDMLNPLHCDLDVTGKVVLFNCLHPEWYPEADVIVTPDVSPEFLNTVTRSDAQVRFAGPRYWFLRDGFHAWFYRNRRKLDRIGVMIGGTDPLGIGQQLIDELGPQFKVWRVDGGGIAQQMLDCDLMLTGCGQTFWESLAVGTPAIPFASNEAQAKQYGSVFR